MKEKLWVFAVTVVANLKDSFRKSAHPVVRKRIIDGLII